jgi:hypothetical protein
LVEKVDGVHRNPFIQVLSGRKRNSLKGQFSAPPRNT